MIGVTRIRLDGICFWYQFVSNIGVIACSPDDMQKIVRIVKVKADTINVWLIFILQEQITLKP